MSKSVQIRLTSLFASALFAVVIAGCGGSSGNTELGDLPPGASNQEEETAAPDAAPAKNVPADEV
ncbi:hypothetical protein [Novipirellula caenicola]|uniref:Uncharacterized protein n=1 Tax=Novipirellula caenicola TaxID=1536901 RepID=A0ABP9VZP9_9BACT